MPLLDNSLELEPLRLRQLSAVSKTYSSNELVEIGFGQLSFASNALCVAAAGERAAVRLYHPRLSQRLVLPRT